MSKTAMAGGLIMSLLVLIGLFGNVTLNGEIVQNKVMAFLIAVILFPTFIIILGYIVGFLKDAILAFLLETKDKLFRKKGLDSLQTPPTT